MFFAKVFYELLSDTTVFEDLMVIHAACATEAAAKVEAHFEAKCRSYDVHYYVLRIEFFTILK